MLKLKELREDLNISQKELGKILKVAQNTISNWEKGIREPDNETLIRIANFFNVSINTLLGVEEIEEYGIGSAIREERENQDLSEEELADSLNISVKELLQYESDELPINEEIISKLEQAFGMNYYEFLDKYNFYDEYVPEHFNGDIQAWENFKKARDKDVEEENKIKYNVQTILLTNFYKLNDTGQQEASKRIEELTYIDKYTK